MEVKSSDFGQPRNPGEIDRTFATDGRIEINELGTANAITCDKDGNLILVSHIGASFRLSRYFFDGAKDESFEESTWNFDNGDRSRPLRVLLQDGKILVIGESLKAGAQRPAVARFNASGSPDLVFGRRVVEAGPEHAVPESFPYKFVDGCVQKDSKILLLARYILSPKGVVSRLFRLQANGELDLGFGGGKGFIDIKFHEGDSFARDVQIQSTGSIIVAGSWRNGDEQLRTRTVARYTSDGFLDRTFAANGFATIHVPDEQVEQSPTARVIWSDIVSRVAVQDDDRIIVAGYAHVPNGLQSGLLIRLERNGTIDKSFNLGNTLLISRPRESLTFQSMAIQPDGKIVAVGTGMSERKTMELYERISENGEKESFGTGYGIGDCSDVVIQPQGRVVISGSSGATAVEGIRYPRVWGRQGS